MKVVQGDLVKMAMGGEFDVIIHGCNCFCSMGARIAKTIKATFPAAFDADCATTKGAREKLGTISSSGVETDVGALTVVDAYTQHYLRGRGVFVDYDAIRGAMREVKKRYPGKRIGYPKIGAALAKGDWPSIAEIIDQELGGEDHTLVEFTG